jgi:hypothetical protein
VPADDEGVTLTARVSYRFMTDRQYQRLKTKYGMQVDKTYVIPLYEQTLPLRSGETMPQVAQATTPPSCAAPESEDNSSGEAS